MKTWGIYCDEAAFKTIRPKERMITMMKQYRGQRSVISCKSCPGNVVKESRSSTPAPAVRAAECVGNMGAGGTGAGAGGTISQFGCVSAGSYKDFPLAMVFTPAQSYGNLYSPMEGLENGTLFADLNLPFHGKFKI